EEEIAAPLVHHHREPSLRDEELEERMTRGQARLIELAGVPRDHDVAAALGTIAEVADDVAKLIDMTPVGRDPVAPLLTVVAPGIALEARLRQPVRRVRVAIPDAHAERVQLVHVARAGEEPEKLAEHRAEREPLRRHRRKTLSHVEAHDLAEDRARPDAGPVSAVDAVVDRLAQDREVLAHDPRPSLGGTPVRRRA